MLAQGTVLGGRYRLAGILGDGGMARVFQAHDERLERTVAIKILHQQYLHQPQFVRRFEQEAHLAAGLTHPNIVSIYDVDREGDTYFIVMEYVSGGSLKRLITREAPLPLDQIVEIMRGLGRALDAAHAQGVIHRDIKPENILLSSGGLVKVSDFGIARALTSPGQTATGLVLGSVSYFSPEQAQGQPATPESDLYSSGIVLYEMLTGRLPFAAGNPLATAMQHITQPPAPPRSIVPTLPPACDAVVLKAMSKNAADRYHSGAVLADAVAAALAPPPMRSGRTGAQTAVMAHPLARTRPLPSQRGPYAPARPRRRRAPVILLLLLLLLGGGAAYAYTHRHEIRQFFGGSASGPPAATATTQGVDPATATGATAVLVAVGATATGATAPTDTAPTTTALPSATAPTQATTTGPAPASADVVTARGYGRDGNGLFIAVDPRDTFSQPGPKIYAIVHFHSRLGGKNVTIRWTLPDGVDGDVPIGRIYGWSCAAWQPPAGTGNYLVSALVDGHVVGSHRFQVVAQSNMPRDGVGSG